MRGFASKFLGVLKRLLIIRVTGSKTINSITAQGPADKDRLTGGGIPVGYSPDAVRSTRAAQVTSGTSGLPMGAFLFRVWSRDHCQVEAPYLHL